MYWLGGTLLVLSAAWMYGQAQPDPHPALAAPPQEGAATATAREADTPRVDPPKVQQASAGDRKPRAGDKVWLARPGKPDAVVYVCKTAADADDWAGSDDLHRTGATEETRVNAIVHRIAIEERSGQVPARTPAEVVSVIGDVIEVRAQTSVAGFVPARFVQLTVARAK